MNPPNWVTDEKQWFNDCRSVAKICRDYLAGTIGLIEASHHLVAYAHSLREDFDSDFTFFIGVGSETDHLPVGEWRNQWSADSLKEIDKEIEQIEEFYRRDAIAAATLILKRFQEVE
jgi:hypothetical protein